MSPPKRKTPDAGKQGGLTENNWGVAEAMLIQSGASVNISSHGSRKTGQPKCVNPLEILLGRRRAADVERRIRELAKQFTVRECDL